MSMPGDFHGSSPWGYLITDDKRAQPLLKSFYKAIVNHIVGLKLRATPFSTSFEYTYSFHGLWRTRHYLTNIGSLFALIGK